MIAEAFAAQGAADFIMDGEVVAFEGEDTSFFRLGAGSASRDPGPALVPKVPAYVYLFDVLWATRRTSPPLLEREPLLHDLLSFGGRWGTPSAATRTERRTTARRASSAGRS